LVRGPPQTLPFVNPDGTISSRPTPVGLALYTAYPYINASNTHTNGFDVDLQTHVDFGNIGQLTAQLNYTHIITYTLSAQGVSYDLAGTHGPSGISGDTGNPKDRATASITWNRGPMTVTGSVNYVGRFSVIDPSSGQPTCAIALESRFDSEYGPGAFQSTNAANFSKSLCTVGSFTDIDFYGRYDLNSNLSVHASILNAFDRPPPLDAVTYGGGGGAAYDAALHQAGAVGRYLTVGATYKF
jgi:iron complex outermembrane receptor protein